MSNNNRRAGIICGSPLCGLNQRVCIEVNKVFDGCVFRSGDLPYTLTCAETGAPKPWTFTALYDSGETTMSNIIITPHDRGKQRVEFDTSTPVTVTYTDANHADGVTSGTVNIHRSVMLTLPNESAVPYSIKTLCKLTSTLGSFNDRLLNCRLCILQLVKVIAPVDLLVPSYGYCDYPDCREEACEALNNLRLFPQ